MLTLRYGIYRNILPENKVSNEDKRKKSPGTASKAPSTVGLELVRQVRMHGATARGGGRQSIHVHTEARYR